MLFRSKTRSRRHGCHAGPHEEARGWSGGGRQEGGESRSLGLSWGFGRKQKARQVNSLGLASLNNLGALGYRHGPSLSGPWSWMMQAEEKCPPGVQGLGEEVWLWVGWSAFHRLLPLGPLPSLRTGSSQEGSLPSQEGSSGCQNIFKLCFYQNVIFIPYFM